MLRELRFIQVKYNIAYPELVLAINPVYSQTTA